MFLLSHEEAEQYFHFGASGDYAAMGYRMTAPSYAAFMDACVHYFSAEPEELHTKAEYDMLVKALPQLNLREGAWEIDLPTMDEYAAFWSGTHTVGDYGPEIFWWLRTPGYEEGEFRHVYKDGSVSDSGAPGLSPFFIRPALWLSADAFADAGIAARATPVPPNAQVDSALTGTWKIESEDGQDAYFKFDADGYHMALAAWMNGSYEVYPAIFKAENGKLSAMQLGYQGGESVVDYQLMSQNVLKLTGEGAPGALTRVDDSEFPLTTENEAVLEIEAFGSGAVPTDASAFRDGETADSAPEESILSEGVSGNVPIRDPAALGYRAAAVSGIGIPDAYFESPEAAIAYFAECVKNRNLLGALGATYAQPAAEDFDLAAMVERMGSYVSNATADMWLPSEYEAYVPFNALTALETRRLYNFVTALLAGGRSLTDSIPALWNPDTRAFKEDGSTLSGLTVEQMIDMLDPARLSGVELREIYRYEGKEVQTENYQRIALVNGITYGFGDCWDYLAIYELDGQRYVHTYTIARYPQGWKIFRLFSYYILGSDYSSEVVPAEEFGGTLAEPDYVPTWKDGAVDPAKALEEVDTTQFVGRWEASTQETAEFLEFVELREDGTCQVSEEGEIMGGVWNANSLCVAMGMDIRRMKGYAYAFEGDRLTLTYGDERYVFDRT